MRGILTLMQGTDKYFMPPTNPSPATLKSQTTWAGARFQLARSLWVEVITLMVSWMFQEVEWVVRARSVTADSRSCEGSGCWMSPSYLAYCADRSFDSWGRMDIMRCEKRVWRRCWGCGWFSLLR